jgi:RNA polymerase sigma-70 factor (sigma-E family)
MRKSDEEQFRQFARSQAGHLRRSAYLLCGEWHLAEDLVQTTLIKMHGAWPRVSREHQPISYARRTLFRCWLDERRRPWRRAERRDGEVPDRVDPAFDPVAAHERVQLRAELFAALAGVPPRQRAVLVLRFFESLSVTETAQALGCSEGTVKSQTAHALAAMKTALGTGGSPATSTKSMKENP